MNRKSKIIVSVVGITIVLLALLGITYAYYLTRIQGNTNTNSISVTTADLKLVYGDGNGAITANDAMPGTTITKTFTVKNTGKTTVSGYLVVLENVENGLTRPQDLTYKLECKLDDNTTSCGVSENEFPGATQSGSFARLMANDIASGVTHNYTLTVHYENLTDTDQSDDMGKTFGGLVNIKDANSLLTTGATNVQGTLAYKLYKSTASMYANSREVTIYPDHIYTIGDDWEEDLGGKYVIGEEVSYDYLVGCAYGENTCGKYLKTEGAYTEFYQVINYIGPEEQPYPEDAREVSISFGEDYGSSQLLSTASSCVLDGSGYYCEEAEDMEFAELSKLQQCVSGEVECGKFLILEGVFTGVYRVLEYVSMDTEQLTVLVTDDFEYGTEEITELKVLVSNVIEEPEADGLDVAKMLSIEDDYGISYYYKDKTAYKFVKFANYYWRIIRINGDGSIRLMYEGEELLPEDDSYQMRGISHGDNFNNISADDTVYKKFAGYMYGTSDDPYKNLTSSNIKNVIDSWYEENLKDNYSQYLADVLFCNDRREAVIDENDNLFFAGAKRTTPTLKCAQKNDRFTVNDEIVGNGDLTYPIGMITRDEMLLIKENLWPNELSSGSGGISFYSMTPAFLESQASYDFSVYIAGLEEGMFSSIPAAYGDTASGMYVKPVINLKAGVNYTIDENGVYVINTN